LVVKAQDDAPFLPQASIASSHVPLPPQPEVGDECLTPQLLLHIAFEVISQLDKGEDSRWLQPEELSLWDFLVEQIQSLQLAVVEQGIAPSLPKASIALKAPCLHSLS
jgi:hypothetical protein